MKSITVSPVVVERLHKLKSKPNESFSSVIGRRLDAREKKEKHGKRINLR
jgi:predicted CopG family antitoxin